ncbi:MAG: alpha/beta hydrolase fold domain-containing protein [Chitinophagaceae bacterium]
MQVSIKVLIVSILTICASCKKQQSNALSTTTAIELKDVAYGNNPLQNMDVYLPANRSVAATKVIVLIHGGFWTSGDKYDFNEVVNQMKVQLTDYAIVNINYQLATLSGTNIWPTQINDVNAAFNFIQSKSNEYAINTNKMVVLGASAGAQLALLKSYQHNIDKKIKAVIDLFGPTDFIGLYNNPSDPNYPALLNIFLSGTPTSNNIGYRNASPLYSVNSSVPATIIFHGTADNVVPIRQSDSLNNRLISAGVTKQYVTYAGEGHGWIGLNLIDTFTKIIAFITSNNP